MAMRTVVGRLLFVFFSGFAMIAFGQAKLDTNAPAKKSEQAEDEKSKADIAKDAKADADSSVNPARVVGFYRPPSRGAPQTRVGGGTRGDARTLSVAVIAPNHTGLSSTNQPDLYWFVSRPVAMPVEFVVMEVDAIEPLIEKQLPAPTTAGIQRISLADLAVTLQTGKEYQWSVSLIKDTNSRSQDTMAAGTVKVQSFPAASQKSLETATSDSAYLLYAGAGYWYDAFSQLRSRLAQQPKNQDLMNSQVGILEQVGLTEVARFESELHK